VNDIYVRPSTEHNRLKVATKEIGPTNDKTHYPEYIQVDEDGNEITGSNPLPVETISSALPADAATQTTLAALLTELQAKADLTETQPVTEVSATMKDYMLEAAAGNITGISTVNKFGGGFDAAADTVSDVWDDGTTQPVYPWPTSATITDIKQSVDQAAMRGQTIEVQGLDSNWDLVVQTKALDAANTTTKVTLDTALIRIFRMKVLANVVTDQIVQAMDTGAGVAVFAVIQAGNNQTLMSLYTVPNGKTAYLTNYYASVTNETQINKTPVGTEIKLWAADRANSYEFQLKHATSLASESDRDPHHFNPYYKFNQKTDIKITMECIAEDGHVHSGFDLILKDN